MTELHLSGDISLAEPLFFRMQHPAHDQIVTLSQYTQDTILEQLYAVGVCATSDRRLPYIGPPPLIIKLLRWRKYLIATLIRRDQRASMCRQSKWSRYVRSH